MALPFLSFHTKWFWIFFLGRLFTIKTSSQKHKDPFFGFGPKQYAQNSGLYPLKYFYIPTNVLKGFLHSLQYLPFNLSCSEPILRSTRLKRLLVQRCLARLILTLAMQLQCNCSATAMQMQCNAMQWKQQDC